MTETRMSDHEKPAASHSLEEARAAKKAAQGVFERLAKGAASGITRSGKGYGLKINVPRVLPAGVKVPKEIAGVPVRVEVVGPVRKRAA